MKYNFDEIAERRNTNSVKYDLFDDKTLPMWVADMDFKVCPEITEAVIKKANIGAYGYSIIPDEYFSAYRNWWKNNHNVEFKNEWMIFSTGVVATISSCVRKLTTPNENVLIMSPVYNIFTNCIVNNGRRVLSSDLVYDGNGRYSIDYIDLENKLKDPQTSLMILCNPQNPTGHIYTKNELEKIGKLALENNVVLISDEIHCDLVNPGKKYVSFATLSDELVNNSIICLSPGKAFNLAGLHSSIAVITNSNLRHKVWREINTSECGEPNYFGIETVIAAYEKGVEWLNKANEYIYDNKIFVNEFVEKNLKDKVIVASEDATYLYWLDLSYYKDKCDNLAEYIYNSSHLYVNDGSVYGGNSKDFIRINLATSHKNVIDAMLRLKSCLSKLDE